MYGITVTGLTARYGDRTAVRNVSFAAPPGAPLAVTGPNGSGKSTIIKILAGLRQPDSGSAAYTDAARTFPPAQLRREIAIVSPYVSLYEEMTLEENLSFISSIRREKRDTAAERRLCGLFFDSGVPAGKIASFSSGMRQKALIIAAFSRASSIMLLDEPAVYLDRQSSLALFALITETASRKTIVIASNSDEERELCEVCHSLPQ